MSMNVVFNTFKGIRKINGVCSGGQISAVTCQNVDFVLNETNGEINIQSTIGNTKILEQSGYTIIKGFETLQDGVKYNLLYAENSTVGRLYKRNSDNSLTLLIDSLTVTGKANGITMTDSAYDVFVFTNGTNYRTVSFAQNPQITTITPQYNSANVTGLVLAEQDGSLIIGCDNGIVLASRKGDLTDWDYVTPTDSNKSWYQMFGGPITAIVNFESGLTVFTNENHTNLIGNMSDSSSAQRSESSLGGCFSFESWCIHDNTLFVYDDRQKNIYPYTSNTVGQTTIGSPVANEVRTFFKDVAKLNIIQYVANNKNEIWVNINNDILIYNYLVGEWTERVCHPITNIFFFDNEIYSTNAGKLFKERSGNNCVFDSSYYGAIYKAQIINLGSWSNLKEMELPPIITCTQSFNNKFWVSIDIDGKKTKTKQVEMSGSSDAGMWGDDTSTIDDSCTWDTSEFAEESDAVTQQVKAKFVSNWYYLQFTFYTDSSDQDFCIKSLELKGITEEVDTTGRR